MSKYCQQYMIHSTHNSIPSNRNELGSFRRVNSPGLPNSSLRTSFKGDNKKLEIGLITDRKFSQSPELNKLISPEKLKTAKTNDSIFETSQQQGKLGFLNQNFKMIEKIESDKLCLNIYMSEKDQNQIIFTGISNEKKASEQNKKEILQNLQLLFKSGINKQDKYIKLEYLEQQFNLENHNYYGINTKNISNSKQRIATQINDNKLIFDKSLSISSIKDFKSNSSDKIKKDINIIEQGLMKYKMPQKIKPKQKQPFSQHNCANTLKSKSSVCKSPQLRETVSSSIKSLRKTDDRIRNKTKINTKSMHS